MEIVNARPFIDCQQFDPGALRVVEPVYGDHTVAAGVLEDIGGHLGGDQRSATRLRFIGPAPARKLNRRPSGLTYVALIRD